MANRAYLFTIPCPEPAPPDNYAALAGASYMLPLCWLSLFDESYVVMTSEGRGNPDAAESEGLEYPYLVTPCNEGLARSRERWPLLERLVGPVHRERFEAWHTFLEAEQDGFFHCETLEIAWLSEEKPDFFRQHRLNSLCCFGGTAPTSLKEIVKPEFAAWSELFGQAEIISTSSPESIDTFSICGYAWTKAVPWEPQSLNDFIL